MEYGSSESRPGFARILSSDDRQAIDRKMRTAFAPLRAMREGMARAFEPGHRWRDPETGRFVRRTR